jgi:class 3 adenylate cyclase
LTIVFLLLVYTDMRRLAAEARADELLTNAIPASIAARLRHGERRIAESYAETSIVFADLVGSTSWAHDIDPGAVVDVLDDLFTRFDNLADAHGLEKIKTIGDAYMAVAGAPSDELITRSAPSRWRSHWSTPSPTCADRPVCRSRSVSASRAGRSSVA